MKALCLLCHMSHWFSPFPLSEMVLVQLEEAGLSPVTELPVEQQEPILLLYNTPDHLLASTDLEGSALLDGYAALLAAPATSPRMAVWRLAALDRDQLTKLLSVDQSLECSADLALPDPEPLTALVTVAVCRSVPGLLDAYLDLELQALLCGGEPDSVYLRRLQSRISSEGLLQAWRSPAALAQQVADLRSQLVRSSELLEDQQKALAEASQKLDHQATSLKEAREASSRSVLQLHQAHEELEHYFLADGEKLRQLEARDQELEELRQSKGDLERTHLQSKAAQERAHALDLEALREQFNLRLAELENHLASRDTELLEAREAKERSLQKLDQVQEELEHYFLADGDKQRQLEARDRELEELRRSKGDLERAHELSKAAQERAHALDLEALREQLNLRLAALENHLASRDTELLEAREAKERTLQQLDMVQEELEHYFFKARASDQLNKAQLEQLRRAQCLMARLHPDVLPIADPTPVLAVEVMPESATSMLDPTLQTQALLSTYASSLKRATDLLERARRI